MTDFDVIIIGAGPAGLSAGIYAARKKMKTLIIGEKTGGQANWSSDVENFIGFHVISGAELIRKFSDHLSEYDIEHKDGVSVTDMRVERDGSFTVVAEDGSYTTHTVVVASGKNPRLLNVPGEKEYTGKGVTYCAVCDGPLYRGKVVAVVGGGNSALDAIISLRKYAPKVMSVNINPTFTGDEVMTEAVMRDEHVEKITESTVTEIQGKQTVESIRVSSKNGETKEISVSGVFVEIGYVPSHDFLKTMIAQKKIKLDERGEIIIDQNNTTGVPGLFAAGDVTNVSAKQIVVAAGEGAKALLSAYEYVVMKNLMHANNAE